ncbi:hypothetical protein Tco_1427094 [Tanacetum coccineum]
MEGAELTIQEKRSKLCDDFDRFTSEKRESIHSYYLRYAKLINDINIIKMTMTPIQVNTKFVNHLQSEWIRFVIAAKQAKNFHAFNFDQFYEPPVVPQQSPAPSTQPDLGFVTPSFLPTDDLIASLNKAMMFLNGRVTVQNVQGQQSQGYGVNTRKGKAIGTGFINTCTTKKRVKDSEWFKENMLLAQAQEAGVVLHEDDDIK